jgi:hypothetical protein
MLTLLGGIQIMAALVLHSHLGEAMAITTALAHITTGIPLIRTTEMVGIAVLLMAPVTIISKLLTQAAVQVLTTTTE